MIGPLLFEPLYQRRVWGGRALASAFGRGLPARDTIGESWEIVDRAPEQSVVARGPHAGRTLRGLLESHGEAIMGRAWDADRPFPILVKWLDCRERLSLQVHPPASVAAALGGEPKTEHWFIAEAEREAALIVGLRRGVTREEFERALAIGAVESLVHRFPVRAGDAMFVPSGRVHAIDAGSLILEIQQSSDTTYRVYDWGRVGDDGRPRTLHVREALQCIDFDDSEPDVLRPPETGDAVLAECAEFRIRRMVRSAGRALSLASESPQARIVSVIRGSIRWIGATGQQRYDAGDNVLLPADTPAEWRVESDALLLVTDGFSS